MAGPKLVSRPSTIKDSRTGMTIGFTITEIFENGNIEPGDEWALFRLTNDGLFLYKKGAEFAANIMSLRIRGERAVEETYRCKRQAEVIEVKEKLPQEERERTLIRSVRPKK